MPGKSESSRRRPAPPPLNLDDNDIFVDQHDGFVEDADAQTTEGQDKKEEKEEEEETTTLTLLEEIELFGPPPEPPRGLPTGRPRRRIVTPVGFLPTTNDRYLNPTRERYVPPRDPNSSPFADIPFTAQTERYRSPRRRSAPASGSRTTPTRRPSGILRSSGLPPLPRPLRYENPSPARPRVPSSSRPTFRPASSSDTKSEGSPSKQPSRKN